MTTDLRNELTEVQHEIDAHNWLLAYGEEQAEANADGWTPLKLRAFEGARRIIRQELELLNGRKAALYAERDAAEEADVGLQAFFANPDNAANHAELAAAEQEAEETEAAVVLSVRPPAPDAGVRESFWNANYYRWIRSYITLEQFQTETGYTHSVSQAWDEALPLPSAEEEETQIRRDLVSLQDEINCGNHWIACAEEKAAAQCDGWTDEQMGNYHRSVRETLDENKTLKAQKFQLWERLQEMLAAADAWDEAHALNVTFDNLAPFAAQDENLSWQWSGVEAYQTPSGNAARAERRAFPLHDDEPLTYVIDHEAAEIYAYDEAIRHEPSSAGLLLMLQRDGFLLTAPKPTGRYAYARRDALSGGAKFSDGQGVGWTSGTPEGVLRLMLAVAPVELWTFVEI